ncbi:MAG: peptidoglycan DD-metalloendopeptidase family protein [Flavobacteriales bacterium]|nr:peptidoglycan DD-metalloendopeptidase family protein [Flavobacteriales bacterium]MDW8431221.1 peptidoglycan DD-metalloendopeptidase family protein [Flavobacteriales bacterium]
MPPIWPQTGSRAELQRRQNQLLKELETANKELKATGKSLEAVSQTMRQLDKKIGLREALIANYQKELGLLHRKIDSCALVAGHLENRLESIKKDYARMVVTEYKMLSPHDESLYLLAARDVNDAYLRRSYFKAMRNYRRYLAAEVTQKQAELADVLDVLRRARQEATDALRQQEMQKAYLAAEMAEKQKLAAQLKSREKEIRQLIAKKEKERRELEARIKKLIEEEIAAEKRRAEARAAKEKARRPASEAPSPPKGERRPAELRATPESAELSDAFENNRGRLPWPVERGAVASGFGVQAHAFLRNVQVRNDGIDIAAPAGATVRSVFKGTVTGVFPVQGFGNVVILRHGEYLTVYANLDKVHVARGAQVSARQALGSLPTGDSQTTMNFQIRQGAQALNPLSWLQQ